MTATIAVVAHTTRNVTAEHLADTVNAQYVAIDDGTLGCERNHLRCWQWHRDNTRTEWAVVLEDDAQPAQGFTQQLDAALHVAPTPIVSLYLGTSRPPQWQPRINTAVATADNQSASWIVGPQLLHAVGVAIRVGHLPALCSWLRRTRCPIDQAISAWAVTKQHQVGYTWPSLVDHADTDTVAQHHDGAPRTEPRKAWRTGTRDTWTARTVEL